MEKHGLHSGRIRSRIDLGVKWLLSRAECWGGWKSRLSPDLIASACAYFLLNQMRECVGGIDDLLLSNLNAWLQQESSAQRAHDPIGSALAARVLNRELCPPEA